jgi:hypothetical protein
LKRVSDASGLAQVFEVGMRVMAQASFDQQYRACPSQQRSARHGAIRRILGAAADARPATARPAGAQTRLTWWTAAVWATPSSTMSTTSTVRAP